MLAGLQLRVPNGGIIGIGMGLMLGVAIGGMLGGAGGGMSRGLLQIGTCLHWPVLQSHVQVHAAAAGPENISPANAPAITFLMPASLFGLLITRIRF